MFNRDWPRRAIVLFKKDCAPFDRKLAVPSIVSYRDSHLVILNSLNDVTQPKANKTEHSFHNHHFVEKEYKEEQQSAL